MAIGSRYRTLLLLMGASNLHADALVTKMSISKWRLSYCFWQLRPRLVCGKLKNVIFDGEAPARHAWHRVTKRCCLKVFATPSILSFVAVLVPFRSPVKRTVLIHSPPCRLSDSIISFPVQAESGVTTEKHRRVSKPWNFSKHSSVEERDGQVTRREIPGFRIRRDRIVPAESMNTATPEDGRRSRRRKPLNVKTDPAVIAPPGGNTPSTAASTPTTPNGVRGSTDLRSPGQRASPRAAEPPLPDFITQTDKYGNAITPRSATAQVSPSHTTDKEQQQHEIVDVCTETLLDSVRLMCCCLLPEEAKPLQSEKKQQLTVSRPCGLLPPLHPDDTGKKCLVLDLDETLVHSSFRAVPGADFVIPVQVRVEAFCIVCAPLYSHICVCSTPCPDRLKMWFILSMLRNVLESTNF